MSPPTSRLMPNGNPSAESGTFSLCGNCPDESPVSISVVSEPVTLGAPLGTVPWHTPFTLL